MIVQNHGSLSLPKPVVRKIAKRMRNRQYGAFLVVADGGNYEIYDAPLETNHHSVLIDPPEDQTRMETTTEPGAFEVRFVTEQRQSPGKATYFVIAIVALGALILIAWKLGFFNWLGKWLQSGIEWIAKGLAWIGNQIAKGVGWLVKQIVSGATWIGKQLASFFGWVGQQLSKAFGGFVTWVQNGINWLINQIRGGITWLVNQITGFFSGLAKSIGGFFTSIGKDIYNGIMAFVKDIEGFFASIYNSIIGFFKWVTSGITSAINEIVNYFTNAWNNLQSWINEYVVKPITGSFSWAQQQISNLVSSIQSLLPSSMLTTKPSPYLLSRFGIPTLPGLTSTTTTTQTRVLPPTPHYGWLYLR